MTPRTHINQLEPHPANPRRSTTPTDELVRSIQTHGILQPLVVVPAPNPHANGEANIWRVLAGHRRLAAARQLGLTEIPIAPRHDLAGNAQAQLQVMLTENLQREDLTETEEALAYEQLNLSGLDAETIAQTVAQPVEKVTERLILARQPATVREAVHYHQLTMNDALTLSELETDPDLYGEAIESLERNEHPRLAGLKYRADFRAKNQLIAQGLKDEGYADYTPENRPQNTRTRWLPADILKKPEQRHFDAILINPIDDDYLVEGLVFVREPDPETITPEQQAEQQAKEHEEREAAKAYEQLVAAHNAAVAAQQAHIAAQQLPSGPDAYPTDEFIRWICTAVISEDSNLIDHMATHEGFAHDGTSWSVTITEVYAWAATKTPHQLLKAVAKGFVAKYVDTPPSRFTNSPSNITCEADAAYQFLDEIGYQTGDYDQTVLNLLSQEDA